MGNHQPGANDTFLADSRISETHGSDELSRGCEQLAAMERLVLLSGRIHALVVRSVFGRKFSADDEREPGSVHVRDRREFLSAGFDRTTACAEGSAMVRRNRWILEWYDAGDVDGECTGMDALALDVRVQR